MTDLELADFTSVSPTSPSGPASVVGGVGGTGPSSGTNGHHLSIDLEKGVFNQIRTKTKSGSTDNESNDSGNNSMNTNGSGKAFPPQNQAIFCKDILAPPKQCFYLRTISLI